MTLLISMLSSVVFVTFMPLQISPSGQYKDLITKPLAVAAFVDSAKILGLPKFKLRDDKGNLYMPQKAMMQEPEAIVHQQAGISQGSELALRKAYIQSYVRR